MTRLHVVSDARGMWRVVDEASATTLSEHQSSSAAELAAWRHARAARVEANLLHDRHNMLIEMGQRLLFIENRCNNRVDHVGRLLCWLLCLFTMYCHDALLSHS